MSSTLDRSTKAARVQYVIRMYWRTTSDREMAGIADCSNRTIGNHRRKMEQAGEVLPRDESTHSFQSCSYEVCTSTIEPAPENDILYDPIRKDDPAFLSLVADTGVFL